MTFIYFTENQKKIKTFRKKFQIPKKIINSDAQYYFGFKLFLQVFLANTEHLSSNFLRAFE